jgi:membrane protein required for beta-lactamase induction
MVAERCASIKPGGACPRLVARRKAFMKLIALILGVALEHYATRYLHLRELRWFDGYFDFLLNRSPLLGVAGAYGVIAAGLALALMPVLLASAALSGGSLAWDFAYLSFAVLVVFFSLGPRDLATEVQAYCAAIERGDAEGATRALTALRESDQRAGDEAQAVEEAIFVQATNRIFGVVFWFIALGPAGAWLFRMADLLRRRAAFESDRYAGPEPPLREAAAAVQGLLVFVPARLAAIGYALAGSFDDALSVWKRAELDGRPLYERNDLILARVGRAAMTGLLAQPPNSAAAALSALRLTTRTLLIWGTVIALMTLFGWAV